MMTKQSRGRGSRRHGVDDRLNRSRRSTIRTKSHAPEIARHRANLSGIFDKINADIDSEITIFDSIDKFYYVSLSRLIDNCCRRAGLQQNQNLTATSFSQHVVMPLLWRPTTPPYQ
jgi:hypothetical protein